MLPTFGANLLVDQQEWMWPAERVVGHADGFAALQEQAVDFVAELWRQVEEAKGLVGTNGFSCSFSCSFQTGQDWRRCELVADRQREWRTSRTLLVAILANG